ncbi:MAG: DUF1385 domain-containing protein [Firmicutes bacterium]|nr:DUF1385 domain-containing protein [Bacillota bacterium]
MFIQQLHAFSNGLLSKTLHLILSSEITCAARPSIGGQAVMEGVMMNGEKHYSLAVRDGKGEVRTSIYDRTSLCERYKVLNIPIVRGVIRFVESMVIGIKTLNLSADIYMEGIEEEEAPKKPKSALGRFWEKNGDSILSTLSMIFAVALALFLFVFVPVRLARFLVMDLLKVPAILGLIEGLIRMAVFLLYIFLVSRIKDIRRTFEYHGAEHKTINCFEAGKELSVQNVKGMSRFNKRCGTSFLFIIMLVSILVFSLITITDPIWRFVIHLLLVPVIAGLSYEVLKLSAKSKSKVINALVVPGLWIQRLTTREPDEEEIAVGIASVVKLFETEHPEFLPEKANADQPTD